MFCFQCEQTAKGQGCTKIGVCGKKPEIAALQDLLIYSVKGLSQVALEGVQKGEPATGLQVAGKREHIQGRHCNDGPVKRETVECAINNCSRRIIPGTAGIARALFVKGAAK